MLMGLQPWEYQPIFWHSGMAIWGMCRGIIHLCLHVMLPMATGLHAPAQQS